MRYLSLPEKLRPVNALPLLFFLLPAAGLLYVAGAGLSVFSESGSLSLLPSLTLNTLALALLTGLVALPLGIIPAWLVTFFKFPGRKFLRYALFMPFSCPPYIIAFIYTDLLDYAGPVQKAYRSVMGISSGQPYWFPEIRSLYFAALMMAVTFYPYLYLFVRASFMQIPANVLRSAALAGYSPVGILRHIILPVSRSAVFSGLTLILMETVSDYGTVEFFNVKTFTKAVYDVWLVEGNLSGAALLALCAAVPIFAAVLYEKRARANSRYFTAKVKTASEAERQLGLLPGIAALLFCALPVLLGFIIPVLWMLYAMNAGEAENLFSDAFTYLWGSLRIALPVVLIILTVALLTEYRSYSRGKSASGFRQSCYALTYALPGTILGLGILTITAGSDRIIRTVAEVLWGADIRGIIGGTLIGVIYAYSIRFFYSASGNLESAFSKINPVLEHSAKMLGYTAPVRLIRIYLPLLKPALLIAALLILADCIKELSILFILRPFNTEALSVRIFELARNEQFYAAAPYALWVVIVGALSAALLGYMIERGRQTVSS